MIQKTMILMILLTILTPLTASGAESDIRMRIIANSDTEEDQSAKEALYQAIQPEIIQLLGSQPFTREELADQLHLNLRQIHQLATEQAENILLGQTISAAFEPHTFPDGSTHQTLVITIGEGAG